MHNYTPEHVGNPLVWKSAVGNDQAVRGKKIQETLQEVALTMDTVHSLS